jgi:hypothetical protein
MSKMLFSLGLLFGLASYADDYVCQFEHRSAQYQLHFKEIYGMPRFNHVDVLVNGKLRFSEPMRKMIDSDSSGDGWSYELINESFSKYRFDLYFDANRLTHVYVSLPVVGLKNVKVDQCLRQKTRGQK